MNAHICLASTSAPRLVSWACWVFLEGDPLTTLIGYCAVSAAGIALALMANIFRDRYPTIATPLVVQVLAGLAQLYVFLKVTFLLFVELGAFPLFGGLKLDAPVLRAYHAKPISPVAITLRSTCAGQGRRTRIGSPVACPIP